VSGISEHTVRKLVAQGRVRYIRTGEASAGKSLSANSLCSIIWEVRNDCKLMSQHHSLIIKLQRRTAAERLSHFIFEQQKAQL
ncbi:MAG: hypothetical protein K5705_15750, partial [Oscillospiraceae bacterium]|nr:hypothetical protein [Oscillospiraceae bacterium]